MLLTENISGIEQALNNFESELEGCTDRVRNIHEPLLIEAQEKLQYLQLKKGEFCQNYLFQFWVCLVFYLQVPFNVI